MPTFSNITKSRNLFSEIHFALCEKRTAHGMGCFFLVRKQSVKCMVTVELWGRVKWNIISPAKALKSDPPNLHVWTKWFRAQWWDVQPYLQYSWASVSKLRSWRLVLSLYIVAGHLAHAAVRLASLTPALFGVEFP